MSDVYIAQAAVNTTRTVVQAVSKLKQEEKNAHIGKSVRWIAERAFSSLSADKQGADGASRPLLLNTIALILRAYPKITSAPLACLQILCHTSSIFLTIHQVCLVKSPSSGAKFDGAIGTPVISG